MKRNWRKGDSRPRKNRHKRERGSKRDTTVFRAFRWRTPEYRPTVKVAVAPSPFPLARSATSSLGRSLTTRSNQLAATSATRWHQCVVHRPQRGARSVNIFTEARRGGPGSFVRRRQSSGETRGVEKRDSAEQQAEGKCLRGDGFDTGSTPVPWKMCHSPPSLRPDEKARGGRWVEQRVRGGEGERAA